MLKATHSLICKSYQNKTRLLCQTSPVGLFFTVLSQSQSLLRQVRTGASSVLPAECLVDGTHFRSGDTWSVLGDLSQSVLPLQASWSASLRVPVLQRGFVWPLWGGCVGPCAVTRVLKRNKRPKMESLVPRLNTSPSCSFSLSHEWNFKPIKGHVRLYGALWGQGCQCGTQGCTAGSDAVTRGHCGGGAWLFGGSLGLRGVGRMVGGCMASSGVRSSFT